MRIDYKLLPNKKKSLLLYIRDLETVVTKRTEFSKQKYSKERSI